jgi:hypothetical protein
LKAYGDSYKAGTRPSEEYLRRQYKLNIEGERTRIRLKAGKSKDTAIVLNSDDDDEDALREADDSYSAQVKFEVKDPLTISTSTAIGRPRSTLHLSTLPPSTMTEALECDSETQVRRWARDDDELALSQLDSQDWRDTEALARRQ